MGAGAGAVLIDRGGGVQPRALLQLQPDARDDGGTLHPAPYTLHPVPYTLYHTPYTLHPVPYTLQPTPSTIHPTSYTFTTLLNLQPSTHNP